MISIKKFLNAGEGEGAVWHRAVVALMEGVSEHSSAADPAEHAGFQAQIKGLLEEFGPRTESDELLQIVARLVKALESHTTRTDSLMAQQTGELRMIVEMLTHTIGAIAAANGRSTARLVAVQQGLKESLSIDDVRLLKGNISECLKGIETEVQEQSKEAALTVNTLRKQVQKSATVLGTTGVDPLTGLRTHVPAQVAIAQACRSSVQTYAVIFVMDRVEKINDRFGRNVGDQALLAFKNFIMLGARPEDLFFRWGGPVFLGLLQRQESIEWLRSSVARTVSQKFEMTIESNERNLMLPLACHWAVFPMVAAPRQLISDIETFAAAGASAAVGP